MLRRLFARSAFTVTLLAPAFAVAREPLSDPRPQPAPPGKQVVLENRVQLTAGPKSSRRNAPPPLGPDRDGENEKWFRYFNDVDQASRQIPQNINPEVVIEPIKPHDIQQARPVEAQSAETTTPLNDTASEPAPRGGRQSPPRAEVETSSIRSPAIDPAPQPEDTKVVPSVRSDSTLNSNSDGAEKSAANVATNITSESGTENAANAETTKPELVSAPVTETPSATTLPSMIGPSEPEAAPSTQPTEPAEELSPAMKALRTKVRLAMAWHYQHPAHAAERNPWEIMHSMLTFGVDTNIYTYDKRANAIGYLCFNGVCRGQRLLYTNGSRVYAGVGVGVQGHEAQFLAMLAQSRVRTDYPLRVDGKNFTVADLIYSEMATCKPNTELTFKLISFSHYLDSDRSWTSDYGERWTIPRVIQEELAQPIIGAACGGTHRMTGFAYAVRTREKRGEPMTGEWARAKQFLASYHDYTFRMQNSDGSFSTNWFEARGDWGGVSRRLETTGHIFEWLAFSLSDKELADPRMAKAADYLSGLLIEHRGQAFDMGPCGHAVHGLAIYDERMFAGQPGKRETMLAQEWKTKR